MIGWFERSEARVTVNAQRVRLESSPRRKTKTPRRRAVFRLASYAAPNYQPSLRQLPLWQRNTGSRDRFCARIQLTR